MVVGRCWRAGAPAGHADHPVPGCSPAGAGALAWQRKRRSAHAAASAEAAAGRRRRRAGGADRHSAGDRRDQASSSATACWPDQRPSRAAGSPTRSRRCAASWRGELGFVMPPVRILDNMQLPRQRLRHPHQGDRGRPRRAAPRHAAGHGPARRPDRPARRARRREPAFGLPAIWIDDGAARGGRCSAATPSSIRPPCSPRT